MNHQRRRTVQETLTTLAPAEVLASATRFFTQRNGIYAAFPEKEGPTYVSLRGQGGEEILIGVRPAEGGTAVTGSSYIFDQQIARFFTMLPPFPSASTEGTLVGLEGAGQGTAGAAGAADGGAA